MVAFDMWNEAIVFASLISFAVIVPCVLLAFIGKKMIDEMGRYPSRAPDISMSVCVKFIAVQLLAFPMLIGLYMFFVHP